MKGRKLRRWRLLPLAVLDELLDPADDEVFLEAAETVDKEDAVEVVDLVLKGAGEEFFAFDFEPFAFNVLCADFHLCGTLDLFADLGQREAALFFVLLAFARR